jgi:hypothetical protein
MNPSEHSEVLPEADNDQERRGNPRDDTGARELYTSEPSLPLNPVAPYAPDESAFETFVGGAGI